MQVLDDTLSRCEQINEIFFSVNSSTDNCVEMIIPENDADLYPKRGIIMPLVIVQ